MTPTATGLIRPTRVVQVPAGPVEYRLERRDGPVVVVFHGGHCRAELAWREEVYEDENCTVLVPSRPGYGRTPVSTGVTVEEFADATAQLCESLGLERVDVVVGISAGGRCALSLAARHPELVGRVLLQSAVGWRSWPDRRTRLVARAMFAPSAERLTWAATRSVLRRAPEAGLRGFLGGLSILPPDQVLGRLSAPDRADLVRYLASMRSGRGFLVDLDSVLDPAAHVGQATLVVASRQDGAVPFHHAEAICAAVPGARLLESRADTHFIWCGSDWPEVSAVVAEFVRRG